MKDTCEKMKPALSEYVDEAADLRRSARVERHLAECVACRAEVESLRTNKELLRTLPLHQTPPSFDTRLAERIAALNRPPKDVSPLAAWWQSLFARHNSIGILRPAFAAAAAFGLIGTAFWVTNPAIPPVATPSDSEVIAHCVEQHRSFMESQPLTDVSAQALAAQVDGADSGAGDADTSL